MAITILKSTEIISVPDLVSKTRKLASNGKVLFRGQNTDKPLKPKIARDDKVAPTELLKIERRMLERFRRESYPFLNGVIPQSSWDWLSIAQHQGMPTRLLDWSANALAALWFAVATDPPDGNLLVSPVAHHLSLDRMGVVTAGSNKLVGVQTVRELLGVMVHNKVAKGILHAIGTFSTEALEFARANKIQLIGGEDLLGNIEKLAPELRTELLTLAAEGDFKTPTCPSCGIKLRRVSSRRGDFWGCANYPRCKVKWTAKTLPE